MQLLTGILGSAHGLRGEIKLDIRTDDFKRRFAKGNMVQTDNEFFPTLTVKGHRVINNKFFISFEEIVDRTSAEKMCFTKIFADSDDREHEEDAFYAHELQDLEVYDLDNNHLGIVKDLLIGKAQDLIVVNPNIENCDEFEDVLVPFVYEIVLEVNIEDNYILLNPPLGLFP